MNYIFPNHRLRRFFNRKALQTASKSSRELLTLLKIKLIVSGELPRSGPVLLISNHVTMMDLFYIYSLHQRHDAYFFGAVINQELGRQWKKMLLPVYLSNHPVRFFHSKFRQWLWTKREGGLSRTEAMSLNRQSVTKGAQLLDAGHQVLIFPTGQKFFHEHHLWSKGVAHLLKQVTRSDVQLVFVNVSLISWFDNIRQYLPLRVVRWLPTCEVQVKISAPQRPMKKTVARLSPAELTALLKQEYGRLLL